MHCFSLRPLTSRGVSRLLIALAVAGAAVLSACRSGTPPAPAPVSPNTWAVVNGSEITRDHVEKAFRRVGDPGQTVSDEEAYTAKLSILDDLIVEEILIARANALKLEVSPAELDTAYGEARKDIAEAAFQQELTRRNLTADDMRDRLRRDLLSKKVIDQEVVSKITVTDQDVINFFNANRAQFNLPEDAYHLAQIVITPEREGQIANATGDDATTPQAAAAKVKMLMERLKAGASFRDLATGYSEDPETAPRGGDLGFLPVSRLQQAPPALRDAVLNKAPGSVNVAGANGAYTLVLVVAHEQAGQRDLSTPGVRERITETLRGRKEQLLRTAYLTAARGDAAVVNHLARRLVAEQGKVPGLLPTAPPAK